MAATQAVQQDGPKRQARKYAVPGESEIDFLKRIREMARRKGFKGLEAMAERFMIQAGERCGY